MDSYSYNNGNYSEVLNNIVKFKEHLKHDVNKKRILIKSIIVTLITSGFIGLGLIFAAKDIFLISAIMSLFGPLAPYNIINLLGYIAVGLITGNIVSHLIDSTFINNFAFEHIEDIQANTIANKSTEILIMPLVYALRVLSSKNSMFKSNTRLIKSQIKDMMFQKYGINQMHSDKLIEYYSNMDFEELKKNLKDLEMTVEKNFGSNVKIKSLAFFSKHFKTNFRTIFSSLTMDSNFFTQKKDIEENKKQSIFSQLKCFREQLSKMINDKKTIERIKLLKEVRKETYKLLLSKSSKSNKNNHLAKTLLTKEKNSKVHKLDYLSDSEKTNIMEPESQISNELNKEKLIEIID